MVGARPVAEIAHFSRLKKILQRVGSKIVSFASGVRAPDATSGFRAIHWTAAIVLRTHNRYSYVLEHLIQAGRNDIPVMSIPIRVNRDLRPSRLIRSMPDYLWRSGTTIIRIFAINRPLRFFARHQRGPCPAWCRPRRAVSRPLHRWIWCRACAVSHSDSASDSRGSPCGLSGPARGPDGREPENFGADRTTRAAARVDGAGDFRASVQRRAHRSSRDRRVAASTHRRSRTAGAGAARPELKTLSPPHAMPHEAKRDSEYTRGHTPSSSTR